MDLRSLQNIFNLILGGDIAFIQGVCKAVLEEGGEEQQIITAHTNHFDSFRKEVRTVSWLEITRKSGVPETKIREVASLYRHSSKSIFGWAMDITQHTHGVENIESIVNLALLRGMVGKEGAGLLRRHWTRSHSILLRGTLQPITPRGT